MIENSITYVIWAIENGKSAIIHNKKFRYNGQTPDIALTDYIKALKFLNCW